MFSDHTFRVQATGIVSNGAITNRRNPFHSTQSFGLEQEMPGNRQKQSGALSYQWQIQGTNPVVPPSAVCHWDLAQRLTCPHQAKSSASAGGHWDIFSMQQATVGCHAILVCFEQINQHL